MYFFGLEILYFRFFYNSKYGNEICIRRENDSIISPDFYFRYAQTLKTLGSYEEANKMMAKFSELADNSGIRNTIDKDYLAKIEENSGRYTIENFPYNSKLSDFAPTFYECHHQ